MWINENRLKYQKVACQMTACEAFQCNTTFHIIHSVQSSILSFWFNLLLHAVINKEDGDIVFDVATETTINYKINTLRCLTLCLAV